MKKLSSPSLKSVLAISAGAATLPAANAAVFSYSLNVTIDINNQSYTLDHLPGNAALRFFGSFPSSANFISVQEYNGSVRFMRQTGQRSVVHPAMSGYRVALRTGTGINWDQAIAQTFQAGYGSIAAVVASISSNIIGPSSITDKFLLFRFQNSLAGEQDQYGFIHVSSAIADGSNTSVTIKGWAYDNSGAQISTFAIPEPPSLALMAMGGALTLGAAGLRRWRTSRSSQKGTNIA